MGGTAALHLECVMDSASPATILSKGRWSELKLWIFTKFSTDTIAGTIFKNMAVLATGSIMARVIGAVTIPLITRIYTPEHFGILSIFAAMTALMVPFGSLRYSAAIPLPKSDGVAANIFALCLASLGAVSLLAFLQLWFFAPALLTLFSMQEVLPYWWLAIVSLVAVGSYEILSAWCTREKAFKALAKTAVWQSVFSASVKIGLGFLGFKPMGLLIGHVVSQSGGCTSLYISFYQKLKANLKHVSIKRMAFVFKHYSDFPKFRLPSQFLLAFSGSAPLLFVGMLFDKQTTGQLGLALTTLALPMALFGNTTGRAYYAEIAKIGRKNPEKIRQITKSVTKKLFLVSIPPLLLLLLAGPWMFTIVFGEVWSKAGEFARILAVYLVAQFVTSPLVNVLNVFEKQFIFLKINIYRSIIIMTIFGISYATLLSSYETIFIYSILMTFHYSFTSFQIYKVINQYIK